MKLYANYIGIYLFIGAISIYKITPAMEVSFTNISPIAVTEALQAAEHDYALLPHETQADADHGIENPFEHARAQAHAGRQNIEIYTQQAGQIKTYTIDPTAARHSKKIKEAHTSRLTIQSMTDSNVCFVVELLNHLELLAQSDEQEEKSRHIVEFIIMRTEHFTSISLKNTLQLILFFDIPEALQAIALLRKPLPFPTTIEEEGPYNDQLLYIFKLRHLANNNFIELFGSMMYPRYIAYSEYLRMIQFYFFYKNRQEESSPQTITHQGHTYELIRSIERGQQEQLM